MKRLVLICLLATLSVTIRHSWVRADSEAIVLTADSLMVSDHGFLLKTWEYHPGDNLEWADPDFDDREWAMQVPEVIPDGSPEAEWPGIGWFRYHVTLDSLLWRRPLSLVIEQLGSSEIYLDGQLVRALGKVSGTPSETFQHYMTDFPVVVPIVFDAGPVHVLAVRFSFLPTTKFELPKDRVGFRMWLNEPHAAISMAKQKVLSRMRTHVGFAVAPLTIAVLHLLLFAFYRKQRGHLYYAIFTLSTAALVYFPLHVSLSTDLGAFLFWYQLSLICLVLVSVTAIRFLYAIFYRELPRLFWVWLAAGIATVIYFWNGPLRYALVYNLVTFVEILRVLTLAIMRKKPHAWSIALGVAAFIVASSITILLELLYPPPAGAASPPPYFMYGLMVMLVIMSAALGMGHARLNRNLERQLVEVKKLSAERLEQERRAKEHEMERVRLEADNALKAKELEEARKRQAVLDELAETNKELRETQAHLVQSEKMAALGSLVAGVAHEINTPVGAIASMHNTLARAVGKLKKSVRQISPEEFDADTNLQGAFQVLEDASDVIQSGSSRVTTIVKRLRSFARLDEAEVKTVDIHEGIEDTLTLTHHELKRNITVNRNYGKIPPVRCYPGRLNQVFLNILINAKQAIEGDGEITISTSAEDDKVYVEFVDSGCGIPEDELARIFDPGYTTKGVGVGTGLGLSICYRIMEEHKGEIRVSSVAGKGTTVTVVLPVDVSS